MVRIKCKLVLLLVFLLSLTGCGKINKSNQIETPSIRTNQMTSSITPTDKNHNEAKSILFSDIDNFEISNSKTYYDDRFKFSVDYPESWEIYADNNSETDTPDGDPQSGVNIYINSNKNDWIYVFGQNGHIAIPSYGDGEESEEFVTNENVSGTIRYIRSKERILLNLILEKGFNGVIIDTEEKEFDNNKQQIIGILKSIKINIQ